MSERWRNGATPRRSNAKVRVGAAAGRQFGRVRCDQLREAGASETTIRRWAAEGYLHRELPGVYAVGYASSTTESKLAAALLYAGPGAALSHGTAVWWWGLINHPPSMTHISTPKRRKSLPGIRVHGRRDVQRVQRNGLPVTNIEQTLLDFATDAQHRLLRLALANADYHGLLSIEAIDATCGRGAPGSAALRAALETHRPELAHARSEIERVLIELCEIHRLPMPKLNVYRHGWLVDAVWDEQRLVVELDGFDAHRTKAQLERDHQRDLELRARGYTVLRYTWRQLTETPDAVGGDIRRYLAR